MEIQKPGEKPGGICSWSKIVLHMPRGKKPKPYLPPGQEGRWGGGGVSVWERAELRCVGKRRSFCWFSYSRVERRLKRAISSTQSSELRVCSSTALPSLPTLKRRGKPTLTVQTRFLEAKVVAQLHKRLFSGKPAESLTICRAVEYCAPLLFVSPGGKQHS